MLMIYRDIGINYSDLAMGTSNQPAAPHIPRAAFLRDRRTPGVPVLFAALQQAELLLKISQLKGMNARLFSWAGVRAGAGLTALWQFNPCLCCKAEHCQAKCKQNKAAQNGLGWK